MFSNIAGSKETDNIAVEASGNVLVDLIYISKYSK